MDNPFKNDPHALVWLAFKRLYPEKDCECVWNPFITDDEGTEVYGSTLFADDGEIVVSVSADLTVQDSVEVLAHELAHVAVGPGKEHGEEWESAFDAIHKAYFTVGQEVLPDMVPSDPQEMEARKNDPA